MEISQKTENCSCLGGTCCQGTENAEQKHTDCACSRSEVLPEPPGQVSLSGQESAFHVPEMCCSSEGALIRKKLADIAGIYGVQFDYLQRVVRVGHEPEVFEDVCKVLDDVQMGARLLEEDALPESAETSWKNLWIAGVLALGAEFSEVLDAPQLMVFILSVVALGLGGLGTLKNGWLAVKNLNLNMDALMACAATGALCIGHWPEAAMVMVLSSVAEVLEEKSVYRARNAIHKLLSLAPEHATVLDAQGVWQKMTAETVAVGTRVRIRPGERIPLDGQIVSGISSINQSPITGESLPVEKAPGDTVFAGTINEAGSFEYLVTALASESTLARILRTVEETQENQAPVQRFVDRFAQIYTPLVFGLAVLVAVIPSLVLGGGWLTWIYRALVVLVIACPCALVISTPVTLVSGLAAAARRGILIKGGVFLEKGRHLRTVAFDKTGTLTEGRPRCSEVRTLGSYSKEKCLQIAGSLATLSDHPVSRAIAAKAVESGVVLHEVSSFEEVTGRGIRGVLAHECWSLGNGRMFTEADLCTPELKEQMTALEAQGKSAVLLLGAGQIQALFAVADTLKSTAAQGIAELQALGVHPIMLTGDNTHTAHQIAAQVGVAEVHAELLPEEKLQAVAGLGAGVGMVGDGINDAPALARADIGFAMAAAGSDTAIETADVALMDDDVRKIPVFLRLCRKTYSILLQNIFLALSIKLLFFILTFWGQTTMWMAVFADTGVSLLVLANGLRVLRADLDARHV